MIVDFGESSVDALESSCCAFVIPIAVQADAVTGIVDRDVMLVLDVGLD